MVKILKYLIPKKVMALCLRVQFFLANPVVFELLYFWMICFLKIGYNFIFILRRHDDPYSLASMLPSIRTTYMFLSACSTQSQIEASKHW